MIFVQVSLTYLRKQIRRFKYTYLLIYTKLLSFTLNFQKSLNIHIFINPDNLKISQKSIKQALCLKYTANSNKVVLLNVMLL